MLGRRWIRFFVDLTSRLFDHRAMVRILAASQSLLYTSILDHLKPYTNLCRDASSLPDRRTVDHENHEKYIDITIICNRLITFKFLMDNENPPPQPLSWAKNLSRQGAFWEPRRKSVWIPELRFAPAPRRETGPGCWSSTGGTNFQIYLRIFPGFND